MSSKMSRVYLLCLFTLTFNIIQIVMIREHKLRQRISFFSSPILLHFVYPVLLGKLYESLLPLQKHFVIKDITHNII